LAFTISVLFAVSWLGAVVNVLDIALKIAVPVWVEVPDKVVALVTVRELRVDRPDELNVPVTAVLPAFKVFSVARPDVPNVPVTVRFPVPTAPVIVPVPATDRFPAPTIRLPDVMFTVPAY
jgi:hypothetical protein